MDRLILHYEGYWQCRQATDPDPSDDPRGVSGYTYALGNESDLDLVIRLQRDEIPDKDFRSRPAIHYPDTLRKALPPSDNADQERFGVFITEAYIRKEGKRETQNQYLRGGQVRLLPAGEQLQPGGFCPGPKFELRNEITYHTRDGIIMPIVPFDIQITSPPGIEEQILIRRNDPLDLDHPEKAVWELPLDVYSRRCPCDFLSVSSEVMEALGFDANADPLPQFNAFFQKRKAWLEFGLGKTEDDVTREALRNRLFALKFFSENRRLETRLGLHAQWDFTLRGQSTLEGIERLGIQIDTEKDWRVTFWMGGFDGDVMRGYTRGSLDIPLK